MRRRLYTTLLVLVSLTNLTTLTAHAQDQDKSTDKATDKAKADIQGDYTKSHVGAYLAGGYTFRMLWVDEELIEQMRGNEEGRIGQLAGFGYTYQWKEKTRLTAGIGYSIFKYHSPDPYNSTDEGTISSLIGPDIIIQDHTFKYMQFAAGFEHLPGAGKFMLSAGLVANIYMEYRQVHGYRVSGQWTYEARYDMLDNRGVIPEIYLGGGVNLDLKENQRITIQPILRATLMTPYKGDAGEFLYAAELRLGYYFGLIRKY